MVGSEGGSLTWGPRLCSQLQEEVLLGSRLDSHDWEKISNVNVSRGVLHSHQTRREPCSQACVQPWAAASMASLLVRGAC